MSLTNIPETYRTLIQDILDSGQYSLADVPRLFSLHNNFVDIMNPESNTNCQDCIDSVWDKIAAHFNLYPETPSTEETISPEETD